MSRRRPLSLRDHFAARLTEARVRKGLTQQGLGVEMDLGKGPGATRINRYERGKSDLSLATLEKLAEALGVPPAFLVADSPLAEAILTLTAEPKLLELVKAFAALPTKQRRARVKRLLDKLAARPPA